MWQATNANDDLLLALVMAGLALAVLVPPADDESHWGRAAVVGLGAGSCVLFKLHLAPLAGVLALGWALSGGRSAIPIRLGGVVAGGLAMTVPTFVVRWIEYGNPVFPNYNNIFRSPHFPPINDTLNLPYWQQPSIGDTLLAPWYAVWRPDLMNEVAPPGMYGALIAALVVAVAFGWRRAASGERLAIVPWAALLIGIAAWWVSLRYLRYLLPASVVATMVVLIVASPAALTRRAATLAAATAAASAVIALPAFVPISFMIPDRKPPFAAAFGRWDEADYLRAAFPERDTLVAFDRLAPPGAMAASAAHQRVWLTGERDLTPGWEVQRVMSIDGVVPSGGAPLRARLARAGVGWIITGVADPQVQALLAAGAEPVFGSNGWALFRLTGRPEPGSDVSCDPEFNTRAPSCWVGGTLDARPGMRWAEDFDGVARTFPVCPGRTLEISARTRPGGAPSTISAQAPSPDRRAGATAMTVAPGAAGRTYLTIPRGASTVTVFAVAGENGTLRTLRTRLFGPACPVAETQR
jgi:hypothetical protein